MSYLKDAKIIKTIAENENFPELSEESCRYILSNSELLLRKIIIETIKIVHRFNRNKIKTEDIDIVLSELNLSFLLTGSSNSVPNHFMKTDNSHFELDPSNVLIKDQLVDIHKHKLLKKKKTELSFDWLFVHGKINPRLKNEQRVSIAPTPSLPKPFFEKLPPQPPNFEDFADYDYFTEKNNKVAYLIKEVNPNVLTKESTTFFEMYREIVESYFEKIDQSLSPIDYNRFNYS